MTITKKSAGKKSNNAKKNTKTQVKGKLKTKTPVKKKPTKTVKKTPKKETHKIKKNASKDKFFILVDGKPLKNIKELADVMDEIEDYVFDHHVTPNKNDFAQWLEHVFEDIELAKKITKCKDKKHVQLVLYKHISNKLW